MRARLFGALLTIALAVVPLPLGAQETPPTTTPPAPPPTPMVPDTTQNPVAVVNGETITKGDLEGYTERVWAGSVLMAMVEDRLIWREARRLEVSVSRDELEQAIAAERSDYPTEAVFQQVLRERGLGFAGYREQKHRELVLRKLRARESDVSDFEAQQYYTAHLAEFTTVPKVHLHEIAVGTIIAAYAAREQISGPADFAAIARELNVDPDLAARSGDRGWVSEDEISYEALRTAAFALDLNKPSDPIEAGGQYHILLVTEKVEGGTQPYEQVKDEIKEALGEGRMPSEDAYIRRLLRQSSVAVKWESVAWLEKAVEDRKQILVTLDGERLRMPLQPIWTHEKSIFIPAKPVLLAFGADLKWDAATKSLTATKEDRSITVSVGSTSATINGRRGAIKQAPIMVDGNLYLPPRLVIAQALGGGVHWNKAEYLLELYTTPPPGIEAGEEPGGEPE